MLKRDSIANQTENVIGVLDVGSSKICCMIVAHAGKPRADGLWPTPPRLLGLGHQRSRGIKAGVIVDMDEAEQAVRAAVDQAEQMAGITLDSVFLGVSCGRLKSTNLTAGVDTQRGVVAAADLERLLEGARGYAERDGRLLVALNEIGYRLDGTPGVRDPRGMACRRLEADLLLVTADEAPLRNLLLLVERCYLSVSGLAPAGYASALATTTSEERRLGVTCVDIGGGITTLAMFAEGVLIHVDVMPVGGNHTTFDLARALTTPLAEAERIKTLYGTVVSAASDEHELISYALAGEGEAEVQQTTRARIRDVMRHRNVLLLSLIRDRLEAPAIGRLAGDRVVLTGGASQLLGLGAFAADVLSRPVRIAQPRSLGGMSGNMNSPAFAVAIGLVAAADLPGRSLTSALVDSGLNGRGYLGRMERWLRESF